MTGDDMLRCLPYMCWISEESCARRHEVADRGDLGDRTRMAHCVGCDVGKANAAKVAKEDRS